MARIIQRHRLVTRVAMPAATSVAAGGTTLITVTNTGALSQFGPGPSLYETVAARVIDGSSQTDAGGQATLNLQAAAFFVGKAAGTNLPAPMFAGSGLGRVHGAAYSGSLRFWSRDLLEPVGQAPAALPWDVSIQMTVNNSDGAVAHSVTIFGVDIEIVRTLWDEPPFDELAL